ncbi:uncharacterized protein Dana_GF12024 [Drosophila ananassae]|uniref:Uncharacterized protein n=1 Tax=Drosophila ananassae TaxID=7217 RepID=B3MD04_DROAN|nr:uncharacterized protein Dana_GF12024 [Drosophila ananassae]
MVPQQDLSFHGWNATKCVSRKRRAEEEKIALFKQQQDYYKKKNERAAEKHECDMELHKVEMEKQLAELRHINLQNEMLEVGLEQAKARKKYKLCD